MEVLDRRQYEIWLTVDDGLRCERIIQGDKQSTYEQLESCTRTGPPTLCETEEKPVQRVKILAEYPHQIARCRTWCKQRKKDFRQRRRATA